MGSEMCIRDRRQLLAEYNALTDAQKELVYNYGTLLAALELVGHNPELKNAKPATCTQDGYTGDEVCKVCGEVITKGEVIPATGHDTQLVGAKPATCTEDGYTGDEVCKTCGETVTKGEVVKATGHHYKDGKCTDCGAADPGYQPTQPGVKTGDESNTTMWIIVLVCAAALAVVLVIVSRKKRNS